MTDAVLMVERKLSGVYRRVELEIPYSWFETYVSNMRNTLIEHGLDYDEATLANNAEVIARFEQELEVHINAYTEDQSEYVGDPWALANRMFSKEIEAKKIEQEELMRLAMNAARADNHLDKVIPVRPRHRAAAIELLRNAGLFDEFFARTYDN